ncbi:hypothetical protein ZWY2020_048889 [Hordeum vulgare]|nr:hypothetical protein ZWY2020_048889 [Hordeum vulgare]
MEGRPSSSTTVCSRKDIRGYRPAEAAPRRHSASRPWLTPCTWVHEKLASGGSDIGAVARRCMQRQNCLTRQGSTAWKAGGGQGANFQRLDEQLNKAAADLIELKAAVVEAHGGAAYELDGGWENTDPEDPSVSCSYPAWSLNMLAFVKILKKFDKVTAKEVQTIYLKVAELLL